MMRLFTASCSRICALNLLAPFVRLEPVGINVVQFSIAPRNAMVVVVARQQFSSASGLRYPCYAVASTGLPASPDP